MFSPINLLERPNKEDLVKIGRYFVIGICQIVLVVLVLCIYDSYHNTRIGVVNITGIADEFIKTKARSGLSPEELKKQVRDFGTALETTLHDVGAKRRVVLMPAEAVITGAKDYTQEVRSRLSRVLPKAPAELQPPQEKQAVVQAPSLEQPLEANQATVAAQVVSPTTTLQETNQAELLHKEPAAQ